MAAARAAMQRSESTRRSNACSRSRDLGSQKVTVIGDSMIRGLPKIFRELRLISASWTFHVNEGEEALNVACTASNGLVMYCTAGKGLWKKRNSWQRC